MINIASLFYNRFSYSSIPSRLFVFAGQGTQEKGMLGKFLNQQYYIDQITHASQSTGIDFKQIATTDNQKLINNTAYTQPLLMLSHYLHFQSSQNIRVLSSQHDYLIGHSLGQFSALVIAGSLNIHDGLKLVKCRGQLMMKYTKIPHGMLIIKYANQQQETIFAKIRQGKLEIACFNSPTSIIVAGQTEKLDHLKQTLKNIKIASIMLPVSTAFHCRMLRSMQEQFTQELNKYQIHIPQCRIIRNLDAKVYQKESLFTTPQQIRNGLVKQLYNPVRFSESVQRAIERGVQSFQQIGHKKWISKFVQQIWKKSSKEI